MMVKTRMMQRKFSSFAGLGPAMVVVVVVGLVVVLASAGRGEAGTVRLYRMAQASGPRITLEQVAKLTGADARRLGSVVVGRFGQSRETARVTMRAVRDKLTAAGANWGALSLAGYTSCQVAHGPKASRGADDKKHHWPTGLSVNRPGAVTLGDRLAVVIAQMIGAKLSQLRITYGDHDAALLAHQALGKRVEFEPTVSSAIGRLPVIVREYSAGRVDQRFTVTATVAERVAAVVATNKIRRGDLFTSENVVQKQVWLTNDRGTPVSRLKQVEGQAAGSLIRGGDVIYPDLVKAPTLIKRGQLITIRCISGGLVVRTMARALQPGARGDVIRVRNESSHQTFSVTVSGPGEGTIQIAGDDGSSEVAARAGRKGGRG